MTEGIKLPSFGWQASLMFYTYIIESTRFPGKRYIGHTSDLRQRLSEHNAGKCPHTAKSKPWKVRVYIAFETLDQAQSFELYLKSGSGHAFANRHFWIRIKEDPGN